MINQLFNGALSGTCDRANIGASAISFLRRQNGLGTEDKKRIGSQVEYHPVDELWQAPDHQLLSCFPNRAGRICLDKDSVVYSGIDSFSIHICKAGSEKLSLLDAIRGWIEQVVDRNADPDIRETLYVAGFGFLEYMLEPFAMPAVLTKFAGTVLDFKKHARFILCGGMFYDIEGFVCVPCLNALHPQITSLRLADEAFELSDAFVALGSIDGEQ